jgi:hypothetical protein
MGEDEILSAGFKKTVVALCALAILSFVGQSAARALTATVVMKVSRTAQDSIINEGEDLSIDVQIDGVAPASYLWYFDGAAIPGADERVYSIDAATPEDAGTYRMEAYDEAGKMLLSMDFSVRVNEKAVPKSGDDTVGILPVALVMAALFAAMGAAVWAKRRRAAA